jgi:hypothetical protein
MPDEPVTTRRIKGGIRAARHVAEPSDASNSSQERMCLHALLGLKFAIEGVPENPPNTVPRFNQGTAVRTGLVQPTLAA